MLNPEAVLIRQGRTMLLESIFLRVQARVNDASRVHSFLACAILIQPRVSASTWLLIILFLLEMAFLIVLRFDSRCLIAVSLFSFWRFFLFFRNPRWPSTELNLLFVAHCVWR